MKTFSSPLRARVGAVRDIAASVIAPAVDSKGGTARRPAPATFALADAHLLSAAMSAGPMPTTTRSPMRTEAPGA